MRTEQLTWEAPVALSGETRAPEQGERGFALRLHADPACRDRLVPGRELLPRAVEACRADALCPSCTEGVLSCARSSALRDLLDARRRLLRLQEGRSERSLPRQAVLCRQLLTAAEEVRSRCPEVVELAAAVAGLAEEVLAQVRARMLAEVVRGPLSRP